MVALHADLGLRLHFGAARDQIVVLYVGSGAGRSTVMRLQEPIGSIGRQRLLRDLIELVLRYFVARELSAAHLAVRVGGLRGGVEDRDLDSVCVYPIRKITG